MREISETATLIWNRAKHNALTDLIFFNNRWFMAFRESDAHAESKEGIIRLLSSKDCRDWKSVALLRLEGVDLRDPKFSVTPQKKIMLLIGGSKFSKKGRFCFCRPRVTFSENGRVWQPLQKILQNNLWLWQLTWRGDKGYGVAYDTSKAAEKFLRLFSTKDGVKYEEIAKWNIPGQANETALRFDNRGNMIALVRRDGSKSSGFAHIGFSRPPYLKWTFRETKQHIGGPNFIILPDSHMLACGRLLLKNPYGYFEKTALFSMSRSRLTPKVLLPSGGPDCSYPGLVYRKGFLHISYYSSHEGKTAIYFCRIPLKKLQSYALLK